MKVNITIRVAVFSGFSDEYKIYKDCTTVRVPWPNRAVACVHWEVMDGGRQIAANFFNRTLNNKEWGEIPVPIAELEDEARKRASKYLS